MATVTLFPGTLPTLNSSNIEVSQPLNTLAQFVIPRLEVKDVMVCSSVCREWKQITGDGDTAQELWSFLCHRDFLMSKLVASTFASDFDAYKYHATHKFNECSFRFRDLEIGQGLACEFKAEKGIVSVFIANEQLVLGYRKGVVRIWDLETKGCLKTFKGTRGEISTCFASNGHLFIGFVNGYIEGWNVETGESIDFSKRHTSKVIAFGEGREDFFSVSSKGELILWDRWHFFYKDRGREWNELTLIEQPVPLIKLCLMLNGMMAAISTKNKAYVLGGFERRKMELLLEKDLDALSSFFQVNDILISYFASGKITSFDSSTGSTISIIQGEDCSISSVSYTHERFALNSVENGKITILDFKSNHNAIFKGIADLFRRGDSESIQKAFLNFSKMPKNAKAKVYAELDLILKAGMDFEGDLETAFYGAELTPGQKALAIENYLAPFNGVIYRS